MIGIILFQSMGLDSYYLYRCILRKTGRIFFDFFPSLLFKEEVVLLSVYAFSMRNDIEDSGCLTRDYAIIRSWVAYWAVWFLI